MGVESRGFGRYVIVCDDPYKRGCKHSMGPCFGRDRAERIAEEEGWLKNEESGKFACPRCMGHHRHEVSRRVESSEMTSVEADNSGDPFTAAFVAAMLGGDPGTAFLTAMATDSTGLGIMAGVMVGGERDEPREEQPLIVNPFNDEPSDVAREQASVSEPAGKGYPDTTESDILPEATSFNEEPSSPSATEDSSSGTSY